MRTNSPGYQTRAEAKRAALITAQEIQLHDKNMPKVPAVNARAQFIRLELQMLKELNAASKL